MTKFPHYAMLLLGAVSILVLALGCNNPSSEKPSSDTSNVMAKDETSSHGHVAGPHGGHVFDLGRAHKYHAEIHDNHDTDVLTVYIMDEAMKPQETGLASVSLVLTAGGNTETFELKANEGSSAEFSTSEKKIFEFIDSEDLDGKLRITIDGSPLTGSFKHFGHDHEH